jgi:hypothetical protein
MPFTGRQLYNKNVSLDFGRCPARAMFPMAFDLLGMLLSFIAFSPILSSFELFQ